MTKSQKNNKNLFNDAYLIPLSSDGTGRAYRGLNRYRWLDLKYHSKSFLVTLLVVNLIANCLYVMIFAGITLPLKWLLESRVSWEELAMSISLLFVELLLVFAVYYGLRSCIHLAHLIKVGFKV